MTDWFVSSHAIQKWQITERVIGFHVKRICPELLMVALLNSISLHDPPTEGRGCCKRRREVVFSGFGQKIFTRTRIRNIPNIWGYHLIWRDRDNQGIIVVTSRGSRTKHLIVIKGCTGGFLLKPFWLIPTIEIVTLWLKMWSSCRLIWSSPQNYYIESRQPINTKMQNIEIFLIKLF